MSIGEAVLSIMPLVKWFNEARAGDGKRRCIIGNKTITVSINNRHRNIDVVDTFINPSAGNATTQT